MSVKTAFRKTWARMVDLFERRDHHLTQNAKLKPPIAPVGYDISPPEFVGLGAQKCGTTWWHELIVKHPEVYDGSHLYSQVAPAYLVKEHHFFDSFVNRDFTKADISEYALWSARPKGMFAGEFTPMYLQAYWIPPLLREAAPQVRLLVMLRDPVDRFVSGMRHSARYGKPKGSTIYLMNHDRGLYWQQLERWLQVFPRSQVLILQYEKCRLDPKAEMKRTFDFLGLPPFEISSTIFKLKKNATRNHKKYSLNECHRKSLIESYRESVANLLRDFPEIDGQLWKNFVGPH